jgi:hypothetical protein
VVGMGEEHTPGHRARSDDAEALEEIRQLFARYRRIARHGVVAERDERQSESRVKALAARVRDSRDAPVP